MSFTAPTIQQFQTMFVRDFPYGTDPNVSVLDSDILLGINLAANNINQDMWPNQSSYSMAYLYLTAHYMVMNLRSSSQGLNGQFNWSQNTKSVAAVSEGFEIPQRFKDNPYFMFLTKTNYGAMYLQLALPQLEGQFYTVCGRTKP